MEDGDESAGKCDDLWSESICKKCIKNHCWNGRNLRLILPQSHLKIILMKGTDRNFAYNIILANFYFALLYQDRPYSLISTE
jgi:hypothetical protein